MDDMVHGFYRSDMEAIADGLEGFDPSVTTTTAAQFIRAALAADGEQGMAWWNGLGDGHRSYWMKLSLGASPADAWAYYKRCGARALREEEPSFLGSSELRWDGKCRRCRKTIREHDPQLRCVQALDKAQREKLIEDAITKATGAHRVLNAYDYEDVFACCEAVLVARGVQVCPECGPVTKCHGASEAKPCPVGELEALSREVDAMPRAILPPEPWPRTSGVAAPAPQRGDWRTWDVSAGVNGDAA